MPAHPRSKARNTKSKRSFSNNVPPGLHFLPPLDPRSEEFLVLFRSFLSSKDERTNILALSEEDAKLFIEIVDRAFRAARLDTELRQLAFGVLRRLCGRIGHLPDSYLLSDKFDLSGMPRASGGFADVRKGVFKGKDVAVKSLRVAEVDDKMRIRKHFCKEVAMWKNLSHPSVLNLIGIPDTLEDGRFSMVSEWMANGNIIEYVRNNAGNHLKLLADAVEGLKYLHNANIVHGDLKGANILVTNTNPVSACLADFGFMTIVHDPSLGMESSKSLVGGGTTPFMAPELLVPSRFGLEKCTPTKEADIYAMGMVIYQATTGSLPFGKHSGSEVVFKVLGGEKPSKPANALELGLSDKVWMLLEDCWQTERTLRPPVKNVLGRTKAAASVCGILPSVGGVAQRQEEPDSDFAKFDNLFLGITEDEDIGSCSMERPPSQESVTSTPDSLFSKLSEVSEAETPVTEPVKTSTDALSQGNHSKGGSTDDPPALLFSPVSDHVPHFQAPPDPASRCSTPGLEATARPRYFRENSGPYRNKPFAESNGSSRTLLAGMTPHQREQSRLDTDAVSVASTAVSQDREPRIEKPSVNDLVASSFLVIPEAAAIAMAQARDDPTRQLRRSTSMLLLRSSKAQPAEPDASSQFDDKAKYKSRHSRFHIRQRLGSFFDPILQTMDTHK